MTDMEYLQLRTMIEQAGLRKKINMTLTACQFILPATFVQFSWIEEKSHEVFLAILVLVFLLIGSLLLFLAIFCEDKAPLRSLNNARGKGLSTEEFLKDPPMKEFFK